MNKILSIKKDYVTNILLKELIELITTKYFHHNQRLPSERNLAELFFVSRPLIRDSLAKLASIGLIQIKRGSGAYVKLEKISNITRAVGENNIKSELNILTDIVEMRKLAEIALVKLACQKRTEKNLKNMEILIKKMSGSKTDIKTLILLDMDFHREIALSTKNAIAVNIMDFLFEYIKICLMSGAGYARSYETTMEYHKKILKAIREKNNIEAEKVMLAHLSLLEKIISSYGKMDLQEEAVR